MMAGIAQEKKNYGWHILAKDVADFCNMVLFDIYDRKAMEVFSIVQLMQAKIRINQHKANGK